MAGELEVTFRGMFMLALPPPGERNRARILMPRNDVPRVAKGNERYTIPPYESYVAVPNSANPSPAPDFVCDLPVEHSEVFNRRAATDRNAPEMETMTRAARRKRPIPEPRKETYAVYLTNGCQIILNELRGEQNALQYDTTAVADDEPAAPGAKSVFWLAPLRRRQDSAPLETLFADVPPPATAAFVDLNKGSMRPRGLLPRHRWRYLNATGDPLHRPIAQELIVTSEFGEKATVVLRPLDGSAEVTITFTPEAGDRVIIGCEPLDDILGNASVQSCVEPHYDFELQDTFLGGGRSAPPVPLCSDNSDHRSPPSAACGPPVTGP